MIPLSSIAAKYLLFKQYLNSCQGVTFLAFGNGAPDIFSSIAAFSKSDRGMSLAVEALLGMVIFFIIIINLSYWVYQAK